MMLPKLYWVRDRKNFTAVHIGNIIAVNGNLSSLVKFYLIYHEVIHILLHAVGLHGRAHRLLEVVDILAWDNGWYLHKAAILELLLGRKPAISDEDWIAVASSVMDELGI